MINRRSLLAVAAGACSLPWNGAVASNFPNQPVTIVSPTVPGGAMDAIARLVADRLAPRLGQPVVVDAKPGGGGAVGLTRVARAEPDGHTLAIVVDSMLTVSPRLVRNAGFDPLRDFVPVTELCSSAMVLLARPKLGVRSLQDYLAKARSAPASVSYASAGNGSPHHLNMALLESGAGVRLQHVPYKGGAQAFADLLGDHVSSMFIVPSTAQAQIRSGAVVPLGVTSARRLPELPDVPAIGEVVRGYESEAWFALFAPAGTPPAVVARLHADVSAVLAEPEVVKKMQALGTMPLNGNAQALAARLRRDMDKMERLIQQTGLKVE